MSYHFLEAVADRLTVHFYGCTVASCLRAVSTMYKAYIDLGNQSIEDSAGCTVVSIHACISASAPNWRVRHAAIICMLARDPGKRCMYAREDSGGDDDEEEVGNVRCVCMDDGWNGSHRQTKCYKHNAYLCSSPYPSSHLTKASQPVSTWRGVSSLFVLELCSITIYT